MISLPEVYKFSLLNCKIKCTVINSFVGPGSHYTANAATTAQKQSNYRVEQPSFTLIALF